MSYYVSPIDLAGQVYLKPNYFQIGDRINYLIERYLSFEKLSDRLQDLPVQFNNPRPRRWQKINWSNISSYQICSIDRQVFLSILIGIINIEAPIRAYTQTSRQYVEKIHPQLARFVGGNVTSDGTLLELGLWEKEERRHAPALIKIYQQLTQEKITPQPPTVKIYQPSDNAYEDLYLHGFHRVMTEYSATCLYFWLMAHTTGALQQVFAELAQDEINHLTKFWGFGVWAYPESYLTRICHPFSKVVVSKNSSSANPVRFSRKLARTLRRMMAMLNWKAWSWENRAEFVYTTIHVMRRLLNWNATLTREYLHELLGAPTKATESLHH
jgi:rubrerythrin